MNRKNVQQDTQLKDAKERLLKSEFTGTIYRDGSTQVENVHKLSRDLLRDWLYCRLHNDDPWMPDFEQNPRGGEGRLSVFDLLVSVSSVDWCNRFADIVLDELSHFYPDLTSEESNNRWKGWPAIFLLDLTSQFYAFEIRYQLGDRLSRVLKARCQQSLDVVHLVKLNESMEPRWDIPLRSIRARALSTLNDLKFAIDEPADFWTQQLNYAIDAVDRADEVPEDYRKNVLVKYGKYALKGWAVLGPKRAIERLREARISCPLLFTSNVLGESCVGVMKKWVSKNPSDWNWLEKLKEFVMELTLEGESGFAEGAWTTLVEIGVASGQFIPLGDDTKEPNLPVDDESLVADKVSFESALASGSYRRQEARLQLEGAVKTLQKGAESYVEPPRDSNELSRARKKPRPPVSEPV